jgi:predicted nuclease with TOPRIM domain
MSIPYREGGVRIERAANLLLVAGVTPHSDWSRLSPVLENAGCTVPSQDDLAAWKTAARECVSLKQPGVATLHRGLPYADLRSATEVLMRASRSHALIPVDDLGASPEFWLEALPSGKLLMFHTRPERALVAAMLDGDSLDQMLHQWQSQAEAMVQAFRKYRDHILMVDVDCALNFPADFVRSCRHRLGIEALLSREVGVNATVQGSELQKLVAAQMVTQSGRTVDLINELEACSMPIGDPSGSIRVDFQGVLEEIGRKEVDLKRLGQERDELVRLANERQEMLVNANAIREQIAREAEQKVSEILDKHAEQIQSLEERYKARESTILSAEGERIRSLENRLKLDIERHAAELDRLREERDSLQDRLASFQSELSSARQEKQALVTQLHQVQEDLEKAAFDMMRLEEEGRKQKKKVSAMKANLSKMESDLELKESLISELRSTLDERDSQLKKAGKRLKAEEMERLEAMREKEALLTRLHQTQEELESGHVHLKAYSARLDRLEAKLIRRESRIRYMEGSRSWRMTAPLRLVMRRLFKTRQLVP